MMTGAKRRVFEAFQAGNLEAAAIVLETPEKFGGDASVIVRWAKLVLEQKTGADQGDRPPLCAMNSAGRLNPQRPRRLRDDIRRAGGAQARKLEGEASRDEVRGLSLDRPATHDASAETRLRNVEGVGSIAGGHSRTQAEWLKDSRSEGGQFATPEGMEPATLRQSVAQFDPMKATGGVLTRTLSLPRLRSKVAQECAAAGCATSRTAATTVPPGEEVGKLQAVCSGHVIEPGPFGQWRTA